VLVWPDKAEDPNSVPKAGEQGYRCCHGIGVGRVHSAEFSLSVLGCPLCALRFVCCSHLLLLLGPVVVDELLNTVNGHVSKLAKDLDRALRGKKMLGSQAVAECSVCYERTVDTAFAPCFHLVCCSECAARTGSLCLVRATRKTTQMLLPPLIRQVRHVPGGRCGPTSRLL
jgi:hypothetical protein